MFLMCLDINRLGWRQEPVTKNQWEGDEEDDFDSEYDIKLEEVDDVGTIFALICEELENSNIVRFRVEGFGELPWPVDVCIDLLTVIEQLSNLLQFLNDSESSPGYLDFYEQGIQRRLVFSKVEALIKINCYGGKPDDAWGRELEEEQIEKDSLISIICNLIRTFVAIADELCPNLTSHKCFQEWCNDKHIANCLL